MIIKNNEIHTDAIKSISLNSIEHARPAIECVKYFGEKDEAICMKLDKISDKLDSIATTVVTHGEQLKYLTKTNDQTIEDLKPVKKFVAIANAGIKILTWVSGSIGTLWILFQIFHYILTHQLLSESGV